jgi:hypothetical protein
VKIRWINNQVAEDRKPPTELLSAKYEYLRAGQACDSQVLKNSETAGTLCGISQQELAEAFRVRCDPHTVRAGLAGAFVGHGLACRL